MGNAVKINSIVSWCDLKLGEISTYKIVVRPVQWEPVWSGAYGAESEGKEVFVPIKEDELDAETPLAKNSMGHSVGDVIIVSVNGEVTKYKILAVDGESIVESCNQALCESDDINVAGNVEELSCENKNETGNPSLGEFYGDNLVDIGNCLELLSNKINPFTGQSITENSIVDDLYISHCFGVASDIIREIVCGYYIENSEYAEDTLPFKLLREQFKYCDEGIVISQIVERINHIITEYETKITYTPILAWLVNNEYLYVDDSSGQNKKRPTPKGQAIGIKIVEDVGIYGKYEKVLYSKEAQHLIVSNLEIIMYESRKAKHEKTINKGKRWDKESEEKIITLHRQGMKISEIAKVMKRTTWAVKLRLMRLGVID